VIALWWLGCGGVPFVNEPPIVDRFNGVGVMQTFEWRHTGLLALPEIEGAVLELTVDAHDPEGDAFEIWFPGASGTIDFDPHEDHGSWVLPTPDDQGRAAPRDRLHLVLYDPLHPDSSTLYEVQFGGALDSGLDSGWDSGR
jgi:hypothetical protein